MRLAAALLAFASVVSMPAVAQEAPLVSPILTSADAADPWTFAQPEKARVTHVALDLVLDFDAKTVSGTAALDIEAAPGVETVVLDDQGLAVSRVTDAAGKEVELATLKWTAGVRRLVWLADPNGATEDAKKGPLALEVREPHSTTFTKGVVTLLPVSSIRSIHYEYEKQQMAVSVNGLDDPISGTLQYRGINVIGLEGDAGGVPAKYSGGVPGTGVKKVVFSGSKPLV